MGRTDEEVALDECVGDVLRVAAERFENSPLADNTARALEYGLALAVAKLAELRRRDLDALLERIKRLEERATETAQGGAW